ncbi:MAG: NADH-quinone oxidoreductase subunit C [Sphingorhabdus sp.]
MTHSAPHIVKPKGTVAAIKKALGRNLLVIEECYGEVAVHVQRDSLVSCMTVLRDVCEYQQLMEMAGVDWPDREPRFEIVYCLLSLTKNHRIRVHVSTNEDTPVPSVTEIWPVAGWLEREVFDMYGVLFSGNTDLRRILTDYGFTGHPQRKDFPLSGYAELRYCEEEKRVKYEPVQLAQDFRSFDFMSPWEGADYVLPGDEKVIKSGEPPRGAPPQVNTPKTTGNPNQTGAGSATNEAAKKRIVRKPKVGGPK